MSETALVTILTSVGITHRRAVAFERFMDDRAYVGINADSLAGLFLTYGKRCVYEARDEAGGDVQMRLFNEQAALDRKGAEAIRQ